MAKKKFRFSVIAENGDRSSVWKIWVSKSDVYIQPRFMEKSCKVSLHESGLFHWKVIPEWMAKNPLYKGGDPYLAKWGLVEPLGYTACHVFRIIFPRSELSAYPPDSDDSINWLTAPNFGEYLSVDCYLTKSSRKLTIEQLSDDCLFSYRLSDNRIFFGLRNDFRISNFDEAQLQLMKNKSVLESDVDTSNSIGVGIATNEDGVVSMIEFLPNRASS